MVNFFSFLAVHGLSFHISIDIELYITENMYAQIWAYGFLAHNYAIFCPNPDKNLYTRSGDHYL